MLSDAAKFLAILLVAASTASFGCQDADPIPSPKGFGGSCATADQCASGFCAPNHQCCAASESNNASCSAISAVCQKVTGACGLPDGSTVCTTDGQCASGRCKERGFCVGKAGATVECTDDDVVCADSAGCKFGFACEPLTTP
jgi:hypothetical protein